MSVTREEAAHILEYSRIVSENFTQEAVTATYVMALAALRGPTREQVAEVWGSRGWETVPDKGFVDTAGRQVYHLHCPHCGFFWRETGHAKYFRFCPACGAPMTDEAVDMVMERLEALYEET